MQDDMRYDLQARISEYVNKIKYHIGYVRNA